MNQNVLPPKPFTFNESNVVYDQSIYQLEINNEVLPFYRFQVVVTDSSGNSLGLITVYYNYKYIILEDGSITEKQDKKVESGSLVIPLSNFIRKDIRQLLSYIPKKVAKSETGKKVKYALRRLSHTNPKELDKHSDAKLTEINWEKIEKIQKVTNILGNLSNVLMIFYPIFGIYAFVSSIRKLRKISKEKQEVNEIFQRKEFESLIKYKINSNHPSISTFIRVIDLLLSGKGKINGALVAGSPGVGKTFTLKKLLLEKGLVQDRDYGMIKVVPEKIKDFISLLYKYKNMPLVVLDDADYALESDVHRQLLLQILDSSDARVVITPPSVPVEKVDIHDAEFILDRFLVRSRYIIITNKKLEEIPSNIKSRCYIINMHFTGEEIVDLIKMNLENVEPEIPLEVKKQILFDTYSILKAAGIDMSFRQFNVALTYYNMYGDMWKEQFKRSLNIDK